jgi:thiamine-phosphate pyrophosphorylase
MLPELTPAVERALQAAQAHAHKAGAAEVHPLHLLHGLLEEEEGRAAGLVLAAGLDYAAYRQAQPFPPPAPEGALPLAAPLFTLFDQARHIARDLTGEGTVVSEALLLALVQQEEVRRPLELLGLRVAQLERDVLSRRQPSVAIEEPLELTDITEQVDAARILDACANRAREGLRVIEDYCRFVLDDAFLSGSLKQLRHDLAAALGDLSATLLLEARETQRDVGTTLSTRAEQERTSQLDVVQVNFKRLQEALRSLEEYGKVHSASLGRAVEQIRYRAYTLERALVLGAHAGQRLAEARLYVLLSGSGCAAALDWTIAEAAAGGAAIIQLREKELSDRELIDRARRVRQWTRRAGVLFIVNDRPDVARLAEADGVHLGQDDLGVQEARRIVGPDALIGISTHNLDQVRQAVLDGASYIGVGPTFRSGTKDFADLAGLDFVRQAVGETSLPAFVLGGVNLQTIDQAVQAGARRVAVSQAVAQAEDPRATAAALLHALQEAKKAP